MSSVGGSARSAIKSIQQVSLIGTHGGNATATITAVNTAKALISATGGLDLLNLTSGVALDQLWVLTNATTVTLSTQVTTADNITTGCFVVEFF